MPLVADLTIEATYLTLLAQWWGREGSLHVDCWSEISRGRLGTQPPPELYEGKEMLYHVSRGGDDGLAFASSTVTFGLSLSLCDPTHAG